MTTTCMVSAMTVVLSMTTVNVAFPVSWEPLASGVIKFEVALFRLSRGDDGRNGIGSLVHFHPGRAQNAAVMLLIAPIVGSMMSGVAGSELALNFSS